MTHTLVQIALLALGLIALFGIHGMPDNSPSIVLLQYSMSDAGLITGCSVVLIRSNGATMQCSQPSCFCAFRGCNLGETHDCKLESLFESASLRWRKQCMISATHGMPDSCPPIVLYCNDAFHGHYCYYGAKNIARQCMSSEPANKPLLHPP